jgi:hypothetical protein
MIARLGEFLRLTLERGDSAGGQPGRRAGFRETLPGHRADPLRRAPEACEYEILTPAWCRLEVPNLMLQPIIENAVRHGVARRSRSRAGSCIQRSAAKARTRL